MTQSRATWMQALAEPARPDEDQLSAGVFQQGNPVGAVLVKVAFADERGEVTEAIGKFHGGQLPVNGS